MNRSHDRRSTWATAALLCVALAAPAAADPPGSPEAPSSPPDGEFSCGASSLAVLLRLEGDATGLDRVGSRLTGRPEHSMAELREASSEFGLTLRGVWIDARDWPLDRPTICRLNRGSKGHFVVIRPVGHSGRLVQVIDAIHGVEVKEAASFFASREWTGAALVPVRLGDGFRIRAILVAACLLISFVASRGIFRAIRRKREAPDDGPTPALI